MFLVKVAVLAKCRVTDDLQGLIAALAIRIFICFSNVEPVFNKILKWTLRHCWYIGLILVKLNEIVNKILLYLNHNM